MLLLLGISRQVEVFETIGKFSYMAALVERVLRYLSVFQGCPGLRWFEAEEAMEEIVAKTNAEWYDT